MKVGLSDVEAETLSKEYGDLSMTVEVVDSVDEAIAHIRRFGRLEIGYMRYSLF